MSVPKTLKTIADAENADTKDIYDIQSAYEKGRGRRPVDDRSGCLHPSAVGECKRKAYYEYFPHPNLRPVSSKLQGVFDLGHSIHDLIQKKFVPYLEASDPGLIVNFVSEAAAPSDDYLLKHFGVGGHTDGVLELRHKKRPGWVQRGVLEIKSLGVSGVGTIKKPKKEHLKQGSLYAFRWDTPIIWVWYFGKDQGVNIVFRTLFDQDLFEEAILYFEEVWDHVQRKVPPEREINTFYCKDCVFRAICKPPGVIDFEASKRIRNNVTKKLKADKT